MKHGEIELLNCDCMEYMAGLPDKAFDLAIVDPPYGNNLSGGRSSKHGWSQNIDWDKCNNGWNNIVPDQLYFIELQRVSKKSSYLGWKLFCKSIATF